MHFQALDPMCNINQQLEDYETMLAWTRQMEQNGQIDPLENLADDKFVATWLSPIQIGFYRRVFVFRGALDPLVSALNVFQTQKYYEDLVILM